VAAFIVLVFPQYPELELWVIRVRARVDRNTQLPAQLKGGYPLVIIGRLLAIRETVRAVRLCRHIDFQYHVRSIYKFQGVRGHDHVYLAMYEHRRGVVYYRAMLERMWVSAPPGAVTY
jgi:hypothetical protein